MSVAAITFSSSCVHLKNSEIQVEPLCFFLLLILLYTEAFRLGVLWVKKRGSGMMTSIPTVAHCSL